MNTKKNIKSQSNRKISNSGFTLFIALIVSSLLLAIGLSLGTIILKQLVFSNTGKESQLAFYAADSGAECALYWDRKDSTGYTTFDGAFATSSEFKDILCGTGGPQTPSTAQVGSFDKSISADLLQATTTFYVDYSDPDNENHKACAKVTVFKWTDTSTPIPTDHTQVDSRGYNVPLDGAAVGPDVDPVVGAKCNLTDSNRIVERAVRIEF